MTKTYSELMTFDTFEERFDYLRLDGYVGEDTFGSHRYLNQAFYTSHEWRQARRMAIARDLARDLGVEDHEIYGQVLVHHLNPITIQQVRSGDPRILSLENLITTQHDTHNAIHYGAEPPRRFEYVERCPGDTVPWR